MKNSILLIFGLLFSVFSFAQGTTKITINIPQVDTTNLKAILILQDPTQGIYKGFYRDTLQIEKGQCQFSFDIKSLSVVTLIINDKFVTFPGDYDFLIEPFDDLLFRLPPLHQAGHAGFGFSNITISGRGSEKVNLTKRMVSKYLQIYKSDPAYEKQSLTYMFQTTDRKLEAIDSIYRLNSNVPLNVKDLIKAQLYGSLLAPLYRSCMVNKSDSLRSLFQKFIVDKNRMHIYFKKGVINYFGGGTVPSFLILSEFANPVTVGGANYLNNYKLDYVRMVTRRLKKYPEAKDYLLSNFVISNIFARFDTTTTILYKYYLEEVDFNNENYSNVVKTYEDQEKKLAVGKPFYNFSLPDTLGKIHKLSDFRGKVIVIDFWFNGCAGCKQMVPLIQEIEKDLEGKTVQFISIGIDKKDLWLKGIGKYSSSHSLQLYTNEQTDQHPMMKYLNIDAYPRLIIVDKNGKITAAPPDPRFNRDKFINQIRSLL
ncbi:TlpA family protein disulfide reductase [Chryseobacterium sp. CBSDS_008]|uniref:TlpA family protein disulfide reductase n=1 Tax=Chryseobacterium sp. CBSDS_008 TaxID=3415265 RepID=UPI003CEE841E